MKTNQLTILLILLLLVSCKKTKENEILTVSKVFLQSEWKVQSVMNEGRRFMVPVDRTPIKEAYILKFVNDTCFTMTSSVNYCGGKYKFVSENNMVISDCGWTRVYNLLAHQSNFDAYLTSVFNGDMYYFYTVNTLIFRNTENNEVVFIKNSSSKVY